MSKYFDWPASLKRFVRFDAARAEDVNAALDELTAGTDTIEADINRALKLPAGTSDQTLAMAAGQRANLLLSFDATGNITAIAGGGRFRGDWATATAYVVADYFKDPVSKNIYSTVVEHTSGVLATDIGAGRVQLAINVADVEAAKLAAQSAAAISEQQAVLATTNGAAQVVLAAEQAALATTNGAAQVALAAGQASAASASASAAATSASSALASKNTAMAAEAAAVQAFDDFDKRYLGAKASAPTLDNDGNALQSGALFFLIGTGMRVWNGSSWEAAYLPVSGYQETLVSGTNIKTIGGSSLLGSGDLEARGSVPVSGSIFAGFTSPDYTDESGAKWLRTGFVVPNLAPATTLAAYGAVAYSPFTNTTIPYNASTWSKAAYGAGLFVVFPNSSSSVFMTSPDGITWTQRTLPFSYNCYALAYANGLFVAVSGTNIALTSPDGITWTQRTLPATTNWSAVAFGNGRFVAVSDAGGAATIAATSPDGITWTQRTLPVSGAWSALAFGAGVFVTASRFSTVALTSPDGITWTQRTLPISGGWPSMVFNGSVFILVCTGDKALYSSNGTSWASVTMPSNSTWISVTYGAGVFMAVSADSQPKCATSPEGINWTQRNLSFVGACRSVVYGNRFVVISSYESSVATSEDGITSESMSWGAAATSGGLPQFVRYE